MVKKMRLTLTDEEEAHLCAWIANVVPERYQFEEYCAIKDYIRANPEVLETDNSWVVIRDRACAVTAPAKPRNTL
jgi:hypothetical protein